MIQTEGATRRNVSWDWLAQAGGDGGQCRVCVVGTGRLWPGQVISEGQVSRKPGMVAWMQVQETPERCSKHWALICRQRGSIVCFRGGNGHNLTFIRWS